MIKWAELIPTMCGYSVAICEHEGETVPYLYDFENEVTEEIEEMHDHYQEQIEAGERDDDDEYEGEAHRVSWDGENLFIVDDNDEPFIKINWKHQ